MSRKFSIGTDTAKNTLIVTTKKCIRHVVYPLNRRYRVDNMQLNRKRLNMQFYTDHLLAKTSYLEGHTGAYIYTTEKLIIAYPCINCSGEVNTLQHDKIYSGVTTNRNFILFIKYV